MTQNVLDNSDAGYIERTILWQYDNAENLKGLILSFKNFFDRSTKDHFDEMIGRMNLADEDIDDYGLAVWGKLLNTTRPELTYVLDGAERATTQTMTRELYRRVLLGKFRLLNSDASMSNYIDYLTSIFDGKVGIVDGLYMSISFEIVDGSTLTGEEKALVSQRPDVVFLYPAGVRSSEHSDSLMFGLDGQQDETEFKVGGLDESGLNWRLTTKGNWR